MAEKLRKLIAGNWKMNGSRDAIADWKDFAGTISDLPAGVCDVVICPPFTLLAAMAAAVASVVDIGGQDCHAAAKGAHTGDISAAMLAESGAKFVIVGHSERRADHGETNPDVRAKAGAALGAGLAPIICVGESLAQRQAGETLEVVEGQLKASLPEMADHAPLVVAYEPVWAIGTGMTANAAQIAEVHRFIRDRLCAWFGDRGNMVRILYGGSLKPDNAAEILAIDNVDGGLVGGASLEPGSFLTIIKAAHQTA